MARPDLMADAGLAESVDGAEAVRGRDEITRPVAAE